MRVVRQVAPVLLMFVSCAASAQEGDVANAPETLHTAPPPSDRFPATWYPRAENGSDVVLAPVTGHPYTARAGPITPATAGKSAPQSAGFQARDRLGRTRTDAVSGGFSMGGESVTTKTVLVSDPVAHCDFQWMQPVNDVEMPPEMRVATVTCRPRTLRYKELDMVKLAMNSLPDGISEHGDTSSKVEHLAPVEMSGLTVTRLRVTNTAVDAHGQRKSWSSETWYSPELREVVRMSDPDGGTTGLFNLQLAEPDPKLFYPPDGYRIEQHAAR